MDLQLQLELEQFVIFLVMSILVTLFAWIYLRDRQRQTWLWMIGWTSILIHFTALLLHSFIPGALSSWIAVVTLEVAGTSFLLSVSKACATPRRRVAFIFLIGVPSVLYATCLTFDVRYPWLYRSLLALALLASVTIALSYYNRKRVGPYILCFLYAAPGLWVIPRIGARPGDGLIFFLCEYFAITGFLYWQHHRRFSPGVLITSMSFFAWGAVFPVAEILHSINGGLPGNSLFWDLPKFFVAFGMILTLFENETEIATSVAHQYRVLFEENLAAVYITSFEGKVLACNSAFVDMYGFDSKQQAMSQSAVSFYKDSIDRSAFLELLRTRGQIVNYEWQQRKRDGTIFWILERATIITDKSGRKVIEGTAIDITERKQAELALKESEERFATVFRHSPIGCAIIAPQGAILDVNESVCKFLGRPAEELVGKDTIEVGFLKSQKERDELYRKLRAEGSVQDQEVEFKDASGKFRSGLYFATLVRVGAQECTFGMYLDRTEQHDLEKKLRQVQKMEALGRLAGGVAHDFNNLLGVIGGYAELLEARLGRDESYRRYCTKIVETTERASGLTRQLLTFSRKEVTQPAPLKTDQAMDEMSSILFRLVREDIELKMNLRAAGTIVIDKSRFDQIIFNIVVNARDAMPNGGTLTIESDDVCRPVLLPSGAVASAQYVLIKIGDTGIGMNEETRLNAFEPFFTTKAVGRGTGLGLSTVYGIVKQCNGEITIESSVGKGTKFSILLPAASNVAAAAGPVQASLLPQGTGHILLVEDEAELRATNAEFLTSVGYSVTCAASGPEALHVIGGMDHIDLVISDVVMPKMNGREFADRLLETRPSTKVLFVSGYADDVVLQTGISTMGTPFLQKPYSLKQLGRKVHELLSVKGH